MNSERRFKLAEWLSSPWYKLGMNIELFFDRFKKPAEIIDIHEPGDVMMSEWTKEFVKRINDETP